MCMRQALFAGVMTAVWFTSACSPVTGRAATPTQSSPAQPAPPAADRGQPPRAPVPPLSGNCDAAKAQWAVGEGARPEILERARVTAEAGSARFLRPNQPITMEYSSSRLNLHLNAQDIVRSVTCG